MTTATKKPPPRRSAGGARGTHPAPVVGRPPLDHPETVPVAGAGRRVKTQPANRGTGSIRLASVTRPLPVALRGGTVPPTPTAEEAIAQLGGPHVPQEARIARRRPVPRADGIPAGTGRVSAPADPPADRTATTTDIDRSVALVAVHRISSPRALGPCPFRASEATPSRRAWGCLASQPPLSRPRCVSGETTVLRFTSVASSTPYPRCPSFLLNILPASRGTHCPPT